MRITPSCRLIPIALIAHLVLTGCSLPGTSITARPNSAGDQSLYDLHYWRSEGRLGIKTAKGGSNANLFWEHDGNQDRVRISGPFSQGAVSIILQNDLIYINEGNGVTETSPQPEEALRRRLGLNIPVTSLRFWMMGLPSPAGDVIGLHRAADGTRGFTQDGWSVICDSFIPFGQGLVPRKVTVQGKGIKLKLLIDNWLDTTSR